MTTAEIASSPNAERVSRWLRDTRDEAGVTRRTVSVLLDVTERTVERWEDPDKPASLPNAVQFFALVAFYKAQRKLLVLLGNWELRKGGEGGEGRRSKAGGE